MVRETEDLVTDIPFRVWMTSHEERVLQRARGLGWRSRRCRRPSRDLRELLSEVGEKVLAGLLRARPVVRRSMSAWCSGGRPRIGR